MKLLKNNYPATDQPKAIARFYRTVVAPILKAELGLLDPESAQRMAEYAADSLGHSNLGFRVCRGLSAARYEPETDTVLLPAHPVPLGSVVRAVAIANCATDPANKTGTSGANYFASLLTILSDAEFKVACWLDLRKQDLECSAAKLGIVVEPSFNEIDFTIDEPAQTHAWEFWTDGIAQAS